MIEFDKEKLPRSNVRFKSRMGAASQWGSKGRLKEIACPEP